MASNAMNRGVNSFGTGNNNTYSRDQSNMASQGAQIIESSFSPNVNKDSNQKVGAAILG